MLPPTPFYDYAIIIAGFGLLGLVLRMARRHRNKSPATQIERSLFLNQQGFGAKIKNILNGTANTEEGVIALEEALLSADVGVAATEKLIQSIYGSGAPQDDAEALQRIKTKIVSVLTPKSEFAIDHTKKPFVIYLVGVNGVGKTTTIGKLASQFKSQGHKVMLVAADTFRAAAVEQLKIWSERNEVGFCGGAANADPSSVIIDGLRSAKARNMDVVLVDTAGRLHTKSNLMDELKKMSRMCEKELGRNPDEIFLVVDSVTGQNGFQQAKIFLEAVPVSGLVLTKYDATAKGGIIVAIADETGIPIRYVGLGEKIEDLKKFDVKEFVERLFR